MKEFKKFYIFGMNVKMYMGLYFTAIVFLSGLLKFLFGQASFSLVVLAEILLVSFAISAARELLLPETTDFTRGIFFEKSICWALLSAAIVALSALLGGWFDGMPAWCPWLMGAVLLVASFFILLGTRLEQEADTVRLNDALADFQQNR